MNNLMKNISKFCMNLLIMLCVIYKYIIYLDNTNSKNKNVC